jgi:DNA-binding response OmpR family regulator
MTALGTEADKLRGFGLGADDYVVKPCGLLELLARVRALLKRGLPPGEPRAATVDIGDLRVDLAARVVRRGGTELALRPKEFELLAALVRHRGRVVSRAELLRDVWGYAPGTESRTVETHLAALRQRLGDDPQAPRYIVTVRGAGYRLGGADTESPGQACADHSPTAPPGSYQLLTHRPWPTCRLELTPDRRSSMSNNHPRRCLAVRGRP